jgi:hypothetical protein
MVRVVSAFKIANSVGSEWVPGGPKYFDEAAAKAEAERMEKDIGASPGYLRPWPCYLLEIPRERGESMFFDLGNPVSIVR